MSWSTSDGRRPTTTPGTPGTTMRQAGTPPAAYSRTDAHGYYRIRSVVPGRQRVCFDSTEAKGGASTQGYRSQCVGGQPGTLTGGTRIDVADTTQVDFQLSPGHDDVTPSVATTRSARRGSSAAPRQN